MIDWNGLLNNSQLFLIVFARVAAMLRVAPVTSSTAIPSLARGALALFTAIIFFNLVGTSYGPLPDTGLGYAMVVVAEILLGVIMGLFLQIVFAVFQTAGQLFSFQMGFGASQVYDPLAQIEIPLIGQFLNLIGLAVFLSVSGMKKMFFSALGMSFQVLKGTDLLLASDYLKETFVTALGGLFTQALILAFPMLGTLMLISVTMGLLAKAAPQMNLLMVGFPIQIGVGFIILLIAAPFLAEKMSNVVDMGFEWIEQYFLAIREAQI